MHIRVVLPKKNFWVVPVRFGSLGVLGEFLRLVVEWRYLAKNFPCLSIPRQEQEPLGKILIQRRECARALTGYSIEKGRVGSLLQPWWHTSIHC